MKTTSCDGWKELSARVVDRLAVPLDDPFAMDLVCLDGAGHRRALSQTIAVRHGICTGIEFSSVAGLRARLETDVLGLDPADDPWRGERLALAIHDVLTQSMTDDVFSPVARHIERPGGRPGRLMAVSQRLARVLRRYLVQSPQMVDAWSQGGDAGPEGGSAPEYLAWQPELWRRLERAVSPWSNPLARHRSLVRAIETTPRASLPQRVTVIDRDGLPGEDHELLATLGQVSDVEALYLASPPPGHPLSARFGSVRTAVARSWSAPPPPDTVAPEPATVLQALQQAVLSGQATLLDRPADRSFQVHASHGPDRQVEVLREVLTGLFDADPTLEPRDVVICTPAIAQYASLIESHLSESLGAVSDHPVRGLRVHLSRQSVTEPNQVIDAVRDVYSLSVTRAGVDELIDLVSRPVVAARFGFSDADLDALRDLIVAANIRWGVDANHRASSGFDHNAPGTWLQGVERLLVGIAMGTEPLGWLGTTLPVGQVQSSDVELVGRFAEFVSRVRFVVHEARSDAPMWQWRERLQQAVTMLTLTNSDSQWQTAEAMALWDSLVRPGDATYSVGDVLALVSSATRPAPGRPNFGNGSLLVASLADVAALPHRVVCVVGLDDQHFPTKVAPDGDDLLSGLPLPPFRDPTSLSRQHLLDAVMSAADALIVVTRGLDERTNTILPPASAVAELLSWHPQTSTDRWPGGDAVTFHTLKPYDPQNFTGELGHRSYDRIAFAAAQSRAPAQPAQRLTPWSMTFPPVVESDIQLSDVVDFFKAPATLLVRQHFGTSLKEFDNPSSPELPVSSSGLTFWQTGDRILSQLLAGDSIEDAMTAEQLRGDLAPGTLGTDTLESAARFAQRLAGSVMNLRSDEPSVISFHVDVAGHPIPGTATLHDGRIIAHSFSAASGKDVIEPWLTVVALAASGQPHSAVVVTRNITLEIAPPSPAVAQEYLARAMQWREQGLRQLLPLPPKTAAVTAGLPLEPRASKQPPPAKVWEGEHDADWAAFIGPTMTELGGVKNPSGTFETLTEDFWGPARPLVRPLLRKDVP